MYYRTKLDSKQTDCSSICIGCLAERECRELAITNEVSEPLQKRFSEVPFEEIHTFVEDEIDKMRKSFDSECESTAENLVMKFVYTWATEELMKKINPKTRDFENWEKAQVRRMDIMMDGERTTPAPIYWVKILDQLRDDLTAIISTSKADGAPLSPNSLTETYKMFHDELQSFVDHWLSRLRSLYQNEYQGVWTVFYIRNDYGHPVREETRYYLRALLILWPIFVILVALYVFDPEAPQDTYEPLKISLLIWIFLIFCFWRTGTDGRALFLLSSYIRRDMSTYHKVTKLIECALSNWSTVLFGELPPGCFGHVSWGLRYYGSYGRTRR
ncbi:hypothetical protein PUMCH_003919 [Australozyma saopauloensis]|uniref:Uncharacterized protein n=1 Tax=Australozyma saopauloensis TaxID=291208 RepID=A0AAX4HDM4_9ASCO|nr:hypothetical protein PUMCH_003919 [[Candida] saopauloensis]